MVRKNTIILVPVGGKATNPVVHKIRGEESSTVVVQQVLVEQVAFFFVILGVSALPKQVLADDNR